MSLRVAEKCVYLEQLAQIESQINFLERSKKLIDATTPQGYQRSTKLSSEIAKLRNQLYKLSVRIQ